MVDQLHQGPPPVNGPFAVTVDGHVADVSIDHPPSNIFDGQFTVALRDLLDRCEADPDVRVLLFHSAGLRAVRGRHRAPSGLGGPGTPPHLLGRSRPLDVLLTCRDVGAEEALAMGWLDRLVPSDRVLAEAGRVARRIGAMLAESIAAVKEIVDTSLGGIEDALVAESTMLTRLAAEGGYRSQTERFLAAGGQTRDAERDGFEGLVQAMIDDREGP